MTCITNLRLAWGEERTEAYLGKLAKQDLISFGESARALVNRVMEGEYPLAIGIFMHHALISAKTGARSRQCPWTPVLPSLSGTVVLPKHVPHPYAAMLMIDFLLSKDGQEALAHQDYFPSSREVPPDRVSEARRAALTTACPKTSCARKCRKRAVDGTQALYEKYFDR